MAEYASLEVDLSGKVAPATTHWQEIDELREAHRIYWNTYGPGYWVITRYEDIREAFKTPAVFANDSIVAVDPDPEYRMLPSHANPPEHMKLRHVMNSWFAPKAVERMTPEIFRLAEEVIDDVVADGSCDFNTTVGDAYPVRVFLLSMGLPLDAADHLLGCVRRLTGSLSKESARNSESSFMGAWRDLEGFYRDLIAARRATPADPSVDFVQHLLDSRIDGAPVSDQDMLDICVTLTIGSLDTLKAQLGWCFYHLATVPGDRRRIVAEPELIPSAVEEFLRAYPIVSMARKVAEDVDFHGCPMKKGDMVLLHQQAATRDPRIFDHPEEVRIDRSPNHHIAFGASAHRCLGSHLARVELQAVIQEWHRRIPEYRIDADEPLMAHGGQITLLTLPLAWDA